MLNYRAHPCPCTTSFSPRSPPTPNFTALTLRPPELVRASLCPRLSSVSSATTCSTASASSTSSSSSFPSTSLSNTQFPIRRKGRWLSKKQLPIELTTIAASSTPEKGSSGPLASIDQDIKRLQAFDAYVAELSKDPVEDPGPGDMRGLATAGGDTGGASLLRCATLAAQATKYPDTDVNAVMEAVDKIVSEVYSAGGENDINAWGKREIKTGRVKMASMQ